jgi:hypothetical protein
MPFPKGIKELSKTQKLRLAMIIVACCLIAYALGIVTNLFAQPMFSMFFIISNSTAHGIVTYGAIAGAVGVGAAAVFWGFKKYRVAPLFEPVNKSEEPVKASSPIKSKTAIKAEEEVPEQASIPKAAVQTEEPWGQVIPPLIVGGETAPETVTATESVAETESVSANTNGKIICPACQKEYSTPMFMLDYTDSLPKLVCVCPYCNVKLQIQPDHYKVSSSHAKY